MGVMNVPTCVCGAASTLHHSGQYACASHWTGSRASWFPVPTSTISMLERLYDAEAKLPSLLKTEALWNTLDVDYEPPRVERVWIQGADDLRIYLHRIHPCTHALYHPHPWPSAVRIISGRYEMGMGYGDKSPPLVAKAILTAGAEYEMTDPLGWHYVRPDGVASLSVMVTAAPWKNNTAPRAPKQLNPLLQETKLEILALFRQFYTVHDLDAV